MTIAEIDAALSALQGALARGELRVRSGDSEITYQSAADLKARMSALRAERDVLISGAGVFRMRSYPVVMRRD